MKRLNEYTPEQLATLSIAIDVTMVTSNETKVEQSFYRQLVFWKGEVNQALQDVEFEKKQLPFN